MGKEIAERIYDEAVSGEVEANEALYALEKLIEYAELQNDTASYELFQHYYSLIETESIEEIDDSNVPIK